nr:hypothetical protein [Clostridia bacterium]
MRIYWDRGRKGLRSAEIGGSREHEGDGMRSRARFPSYAGSIEEKGARSWQSTANRI